MEKSIREFSGHSGSKIFLMEGENGLFVRKINNVQRNIERLRTLKVSGYPVPEIYHYKDETMDMEYIHGLDMKNYLRMNGVNEIYKFIENTINSFAKESSDKDYTQTYYERLDGFNNNHNLPFRTEELIDKLPKILPKSVYHGDLTLENILSTENGFYMIDPVKTDYDSYIFDIAKMRQDLECKWFLRKDNLKIDVKLKNLQDKIFQKFPMSSDNNLLILMLLRVLNHSTKNDDNYIFLMNHINKLWKNTK